MGVTAYIWSGRGIDGPEEQRKVIQDYARAHGITVDRFIEVPWPGSRKSPKDEKLERFTPGGTIIVSDFALLGRGLSEVVSRADAIIKRGRLIAVRQNLDTGIKDRMQVSELVEMVFSMLAKTQKDIVRRRARQGVAEKKTQGRPVGRPKGSMGKSKLEKHAKEIEQLLKDEPPMTFIARKFHVSWITVDRFLKRKKLGKYSESSIDEGGSYGNNDKS